nr:hypothetical protein [Candidatus Freyarchaeota archaeon]
MSRVKAYIKRLEDIDAVALLLHGESKTEAKVEIGGIYKIEINNKLKEIENMELRKQVVQYNMIYCLLNIERQDLTTDKNRRRRGKQEKTIPKDLGRSIPTLQQTQGTKRAPTNQKKGGSRTSHKQSPK